MPAINRRMVVAESAANRGDPEHTFGPGVEHLESFRHREALLSMTRRGNREDGTRGAAREEMAQRR